MSRLEHIVMSATVLLLVVGTYYAYRDFAHMPSDLSAAVAVVLWLPVMPRKS